MEKNKKHFLLSFLGFSVAVFLLFISSAGTASAGIISDFFRGEGPNVVERAVFDLPSEEVPTEEGQAQSPQAQERARGEQTSAAEAIFGWPNPVVWGATFVLISGVVAMAIMAAPVMALGATAAVIGGVLVGSLGTELICSQTVVCNSYVLKDDIAKTETLKPGFDLARRGPVEEEVLPADELRDAPAPVAEPSFIEKYIINPFKDYVVDPIKKLFSRAPAIEEEMRDAVTEEPAEEAPAPAPQPAPEATPTPPPDQPTTLTGANARWGGNVNLSYHGCYDSGMTLGPYQVRWTAMLSQVPDTPDAVYRGGLILEGFEDFGSVGTLIVRWNESQQRWVLDLESGYFAFSSVTGSVSTNPAQSTVQGSLQIRASALPVILEYVGFGSGACQSGNGSFAGGAGR